MLLSDRMLAFLAQFFLKKISRKFCGIEKRHYLCNRNQQNVDSVAQLVEQMTLNHWVESSSLSGVTYKDHKKWKITENQAFSVIFILSETPEIGKI